MATATLTGDLITDASRALGIEGDGRLNDSSVGIYPSRHNLLPNGGFEQDTRYWSAIGGVFTRSTTAEVFGTFDGRVTADGSQTYILATATNVVSNPVQGDSYSFGGWVTPSAGMVGKTLSPYIQETGGAAAGEITAQTNHVLTSGRQLITVTTKIKAADRTAIATSFQVLSVTSGDDLDIDGWGCYNLGYLPPYVEASEVLVPFVASPNLASNPSFESPLSGWTSTLCTFSQDATHVHDALQAAKQTATGAGNIASYKQFFTGAPIPLTRYAFRIYVYAPADMVGKTASLYLIGTGGTHDPDVFISASKTLTLGWNYILIHDIPTYADHTGIRVQLQVNGVTSGQTLWWDDISATDNYIVPIPATVSTSAGTITIPMAAASPRTGWLSLSVRPAWSTAPAVQPGRPVMPATLAEIPADGGTGSLSITFDGGNIVVTRANGSGSERAKAPWAPEVNVASVISATWDELGVSVSVEGRPLVGPFQTIAADDFERANAPLNGSVTPIGGKVWSAGGSSLPRIVSGRYEPDAVNLGNGYAYLNLGEIPARIRGTISYTGGTGSGTHTIAMADAMGSLVNLVHLFLNTTATNYQWRENNGAFNNYRGATFTSAIPTDGTSAALDIVIQGDTLSVSHNGEWFSFRHESIARMSTPYVFWEVGRVSGGLISRWHDIAADRYSNWAARSTNIPARFDGIAYLGSNGDGSGHICGDILWAMTGNGTLSPADIAALNTASPDPDAGTVASTAKVKLVWPANTTATWGYQRPGPSISTRQASITGLARSV